MDFQNLKEEVIVQNHFNVSWLIILVDAINQSTTHGPH